MTAPRSCPRCGSHLSPDVRRCTTCYEPVRELSPRAPIHVGDFVGTPLHRGGDIPRWTRWESTATTFGPWGRVGLTGLILVTLIPALAFNGLVYVIAFPVVATVLLREIWAKGWYVPGEAAEEEPHAPDGSSSAPPRTRTIESRTIIRWSVGIAAAFVFAYGNMGVKVGVIGLAAVALLVWFWRDFGG